jgi:hypothetical protein
VESSSKVSVRNNRKIDKDSIRTKLKLEFPDMVSLLAKTPRWSRNFKRYQFMRHRITEYLKNVKNM